MEHCAFSKVSAATCLRGVIAALIFCSTVSGEAVTISGVVKNRQTNTPLSSAAVILEGYPLSTQTDAKGAFMLTGEITGTLSGRRIAPETVSGRQDGQAIILIIPVKTAINFCFYSVNGRASATIKQARFDKGVWRMVPGLTPGLYVCRMEVFGVSSTFNYYSAKSAGRSSFIKIGEAIGATPAAKQVAATPAAAYTLAVSKANYVTSRTTLTSGTQNGLSVLLDSIAFAAGMNDAQTRTMLRSLIGTDSIVFIKRNSYNANHYYTEFIGGDWRPGGSICVLNLVTGSVRNIATGLSNGIYRHCDVSYDGKKVLFDFKKSLMTGYRIYEANIATGALKQLTFPQANEDSLVNVYKNSGTQGPNIYHHGTDDIDPCYLPDGGVAFASTRCQIGTPCDGPDAFSSTNIYRMNGDGSAMTPLSSHGMASETGPAVLPDGRIIYSRWEYVDKGGSCVKGLWAMFPNGAGSSEIYGNDIQLPPAKVQPRAIPGTVGKYVFLGVPHYPQGQYGTVIKIDMSKNIRTRDPMSWVTPEVDVRAEGNWWWSSAGNGNLYRNPYPLSEDLYLVSFKPGTLSTNWSLTNGYGLYVLDGKGKTYQFYRDAAISCWAPLPIKPRPKEPVPFIPLDAALAAKNQAVCTVNDIYFGMENVARGSIKYIRILEQMPRPWAAKRFWSGDGQGTGQQHVPISKSTRLWPAALWGVVPVESDGSANFYVPADRAVFFHALDSCYRMIQFERTWVNYKPGETRSCHGCHETPNQVVPPPSQVPIALRRSPSVPSAQPGDASAQKVLYYPDYVQPIFDKNCISCHNATSLKGNLNLKGDLTYLFSVSYEQLLNRRALLGNPIDEIGPKVGNADYMPAKSMFSNQSALMKMLGAPGITITNATNAARATVLAAQHKDIHLTLSELVNLGLWIDNNCQYYGHYWGRRGTEYKGLIDFRPILKFEDAVGSDLPKYGQQPTAADTLWYKFNESSGTSADDASGKNRNGTLAGNASWTPGKSGNAVSLNGTSDYVSVPDFGTCQQFTLSAWVNPSSLDNAMNSIMHCDGWESGDVHFMVLSNGQLQLSVNGTSPVDRVSTGSVATGSWQHIAVVYSGGTARFYINGSLSSTGSYTTTQSANLISGMRLGGWSGGGRFFAGKIDDFRMYNRALTDAQVLAIYSSPN